MSPTGQFLAIRSDDRKSVSILDLKTMSPRGPGLRVNFEINWLALSSTGDQMVVRSNSGLLRTWSNILESPKFVARSTQKHEGAYLQFSPDDRFIASFYDDGAKLWDASNLSLIWEHPGVWWGVAFHPLGNRVVFSYECSFLDVNI